MTPHTEAAVPLKQLSCMQLMPQQTEAMQVLQQRAIHLAKPPLTATNNNTVAYVCFKLGANQNYGIVYPNVKEVILNTNLAKVPYTPEYIAGIINWRGLLFAILDLKHFFKIKAEHATNSHIIVIVGNGTTVGVLADGVESSNAYDPTTLQAPLPATGMIKSEYIIGIDNGHTAILNIEAILADLHIGKS